MPFTLDEFSLLKTLTELDGVSGREDQIRNYLHKTYTELGYEVLFDNLGSIVALKKSKNENAKRVLLDAHMDEVGFFATFKDGDHYNLIHIGYINVDTIQDARVKVYHKDKVITKGTVNPLNGALVLYPDEDVEICHGDMVTFEKEFLLLDGDNYVCKAYDDRFGLAIGIELLRHVNDIELDFDLYVSGSVREEVGLKGAITVANLVKPDLAIALDCSRATEGEFSYGKIGKGALVRFYDPAMMSFKDLIDFQVKTFEKHNVTYQWFATGGGTNAGAIHTSGIGVRTLTNCVCGIDIHTDKTIISSFDYQQAKKGLFALIEDIHEVL